MQKMDVVCGNHAKMVGMALDQLLKRGRWWRREMAAVDWKFGKDPTNKLRA